MTALAEQMSALKATDRCDRCGAQAYVRAELSNGGELLFCAHHAREHEDRLREMEAQLRDETGRLVDASTGTPDED